MQLDPLVVVCLFIIFQDFSLFFFFSLSLPPIRPSAGAEGQRSTVTGLGSSRVKILETVSRFHRSALQLPRGLNTSVCLLSEGATARHKGLAAAAATTATTISPVAAALESNAQVGSLASHRTVCCLLTDFGLCVCCIRHPEKTRTRTEQSHMMERPPYKWCLPIIKVFQPVSEIRIWIRNESVPEMHSASSAS